jgi:hypothetical protein
MLPTLIFFIYTPPKAVEPDGRRYVLQVMRGKLCLVPVVILEKGGEEEGYHEGDSCTKGTVGRHTSSTISTTLIAKDRAHTKLARPDCLGPTLYDVCDRRGKDCKRGE